MRRTSRLLIGALLALILAVPVAAQIPSKLRLVVILDVGSATSPPPWIPSLRHELAELGWVEGRTVKFETRYAENRVNRMATLAREVAVLNPDLIFTHGPPTMIRAVTENAGNIPIVVGASGDLVQDGFARSLARPGGNVTGMTLLYGQLDLKRLELLKEAVPKVRRVGVLVNAATAGRYAEELSESARALGLQLQMEGVSNPDDIRTALTALKDRKADALLIMDEPLLSRATSDVAAIALALRLPSVSQSPRFAESGGLFQLGADILETFRRSAGHVDKILRGAKPGDLPIEQPTKLELIVNLKTAKTLGLILPPLVLVRAGRLIE